MKRILAAAVVLSCVVASALADENVRTAEAKLKEAGFYFGPVNGQTSSDFSAAVTRYQIRNGLQITGKLNEETSKALGVKPEVTAEAAAAPNSETWRGLRKSNKQFLTRAATAPANAAPQTESPTKALTPAAPDSSKLLLSPDRLRDYVGAFVLAGLDPQIGAELEFFGDRVHYYNDGVVGRERVRTDLQRYARQWPQRRFWLAGDVEVTPQPDSRLRVTFPLRYELKKGAKQRSGKIRKTLLLEVRGEDLQIVAVDERKA
ncbi:MAG: peptidoglycan-binding domain-containing protein [Chthoniobacterales bacterium]